MVAEKPGLLPTIVEVSLLADPTGNFQNRKLAELDPSLVLAGEASSSVGRWQEVPPPFGDAVRFRSRFIKGKGKI